MGGVFVRTDRLEEVGTDVLVELVKPGWKKDLTLSARITTRVDALDSRIFRRMPGMGMQFTRVDETQHERLRSLLRELGAPDEDLEVTLRAEETEEELRALDFDQSDPGELPLIRQPQPLWQQVSLVQAALDGALAEGGPTPGSAPLEVTEAGESQKLRTQLRGILMQLSDAQKELADRNAEIERLREELGAMRAALDRALRG